MEFVRVKRRYDEDPFNSIVVSHKKLKSIGTDSSEDCVFQFAATIKNEVNCESLKTKVYSTYYIKIKFHFLW